MLTVAWSNVVVRKSRLMMSALGIALAVAFVCGTFIVTDTMRTALIDSLSQSPSQLSAAVQRVGQARTVPRELVGTVRGVPGVAVAEGNLYGAMTALGPDGRRLSAEGDQGVLVGIPADERLSPVQMVAGQAASRPDEVVLDQFTARSRGLAIGATVSLPDPRSGAAVPYRVSGLFVPGPKLAKYGKTAMVGMPYQRAVEALNAVAVGRIDVLAEPGVSPGELVERLRAALGPGYSVLTGEEVRRQEANEALSALDAFINSLLIFALISVLISGFLVYNTFSIIMAQRVRETALLRCVGATRWQVLTTALTEAALIGLAASAVGAVVGIGLAYAALGLVIDMADGIDLSGTTPEINASSLLLALAVGIGMTLVAASVPVKRTGRVPPIAALREVHASEGTGPRRGPTVLAAVAALAGLALAGYGTAIADTGDDSQAELVLSGAGTTLLLIAVIAAGPRYLPVLAAMAGPAAKRLAGAPGRLAVENIRRNPSRSANTTAALVIGLALVTLVSVLTSSMTASIAAGYAKHSPFDYTLVAEGGNTPMPAQVLASVTGSEQVGGIVTIRQGGVRTDIEVKGEVLRPQGVNPEAARLAPDAVARGSLAAFGPGTIAMERKLAERMRIDVGDVLEVRAETTGITLKLRVIALLDALSPFGPVAMAEPDFVRIAPDKPVSVLLVRGAAGVGEPELRAAVERATTGFPSVAVLSRVVAARQWNTSVETLRTLLLALLGLSVVIAFFSLANTLSLSVVERRAEFGLLRALGMTRAQLRRTLGAESVVMSTLGVGVGIVLGAGFGWVLSRSLAIVSEARFSISGVFIPAFAVMGVLVGLLAGILPARRAATAPIVETLTKE
ncbi:ABC transporter permease [Microbispora sp. KK1-11]|uniref:ABC transporter permease n=1 Tax=Microbispora sp. KK1-11 TaxID=2053005 RepID=UPI001158B672|nr:ABC transporter permease [Microbispora sp. KK1-11]TQS25192.1 FtsX-like permease family protein [Microbispora sp. KK1-11]